MLTDHDKAKAMKEASRPRKEIEMGPETKSFMHRVHRLTKGQPFNIPQFVRVELGREGRLAADTIRQLGRLCELVGHTAEGDSLHVAPKVAF